MHKPDRIYRYATTFVLLLWGLWFGVASAAPVSEDVIRQVATNYIANHVSLHGNWNGSTQPVIASINPVTYRGEAIAYHVSVSPVGYLFMAYDDEFSPVLLYSPTSDFDPERVGVQDSPESWIIPETHAVAQSLKRHKANTPGLDMIAPDKRAAESRAGRAWTFFNRSATEFTTQTRVSPTRNRDFVIDTGMDTAATVGPLLGTAWNQSGNTYNYYTPGISDQCTHTPTGCVATAAAQIMKYWSWPTTGTGSHSYPWNAQILFADFNHTYNWTQMPSALTSSSTTAQIDAVARLMSDVGIATGMYYGCSGSGAYTEYMAQTVLPTYFKYKPGVQSISRANYTALPFFDLIKAELDASPPRPMLYQMRTPDRSSGHAVVVDGYQTGITDMVHINLGWGGSYTAYYDITNNWSSGNYTWDATTQVAFTHIEPVDAALSCFPSIAAASQWVAATAASGSVGVTVNAGCAWSATSNANWISITSGGSGNGNGTVSFAVAGNVSTNSRTGTLTIAGQAFTVNQAGSGGSSANWIVNPGFESGSSSWSETSTGGFSIVTYEPDYAHSGNYDAWLGGYNSGSDSIFQQLSIPATAQIANLQFWSWIYTDESSTLMAYDIMTVGLFSASTGAQLATFKTLSNLNASIGWVMQTGQVDVTSLRGQSVYLKFVATMDSWLATSFTIDDVSYTMSSSTILPAAPTIGTANSGNREIKVAFTPGNIGSGTLDKYWAACSANDVDYFFGSGSASPVIVSGLTNGISYHCWAMTRSTDGDSAWSASSNFVSPRKKLNIAPILMLLLN